MTTCQRCRFNHRKKCPIDWTREMMLDVPYWDCSHHVDQASGPDDSASERALRYAERHVRRKGRRL